MRRNHHGSDEGPPLPLSIVLFEGVPPEEEAAAARDGSDLASIPASVSAMGRSLLAHVGAQEIGIDSTLCAPWLERGNRPLKDVNRMTGEGLTLSFVSWEASTSEPRRQQVLRGFFFLMLMAVPSLALVWMLLWIGGRSETESTTPVAIIGPFTSDFSLLPADLLQGTPVARGRRIVRYRSVAPEGIAYHRLLPGSIQVSGRISRSREGFRLTVELTLYPRGVLYNRVIMPLTSASSEAVRAGITESMKRLITSLEAPTSLTEFTHLFALCGLDEIPSFMVEPAAGSGTRIRFSKPKHQSNTCLRDLIGNLPAQLAGAQAHGS